MSNKKQYEAKLNKALNEQKMIDEDQRIKDALLEYKIYHGLWPLPKKNKLEVVNYFILQLLEEQKKEQEKKEQHEKDLIVSAKELDECVVFMDNQRFVLFDKIYFLLDTVLGKTEEDQTLIIDTIKLTVKELYYHIFPDHNPE